MTKARNQAQAESTSPELDALFLLLLRAGNQNTLSLEDYFRKGRQFTNNQRNQVHKQTLQLAKSANLIERPDQWPISETASALERLLSGAVYPEQQDEPWKKHLYVAKILSGALVSEPPEDTEITWATGRDSSLYWGEQKEWLLQEIPQLQEQDFMASTLLRRGYASPFWGPGVRPDAIRPERRRRTNQRLAMGTFIGLQEELKRLKRVRDKKWGSGSSQKITPASEVQRDRESIRGTVVDALGVNCAEGLDAGVSFYPSAMTSTHLGQSLSVSPTGSTEAEHGRSAEEASASAQSEVREYLGELQNYRRAVILGDPGGGKSTLIKALTLRQLRDEGRVALFVSLPRLARAIENLGHRVNASILAMRVVEAFEDQWGKVAPQSAHSGLVKSLKEDPDTYIVLDALDEVPGSHRTKVESALKTLEDLPARIIVSSRELGYESLGRDWSHFTLNHLTQDECRQFFQAWHQQEETSPVVSAEMSAVWPDSGEGIASIPVLLGIVAHIASAGESLPQNQGQLYQKYVRLLLERRWKEDEKQRRGAHPELGRLKRVTPLIAWLMATNEAAVGGPGSWQEAASEDDLSARMDSSLHDALRTVLYEDGLLVPQGQHEGRRWIHRTMHEHLVGQYLADQFRSDPEEGRKLWGDISQHSHNSWTEAMLHAVDLLGTTQQLEALNTFEELMAEGDPGLVIREGFLQLFRRLPADHEFRKMIRDWQYEKQWYGQLVRTDKEYISQRLREDLQNSPLWGSGAAREIDRIAEDPNWARELISDVKPWIRSGRLSFELVMQWMRAKRVPEEPFEHYLDLVRTDPNVGPISYQLIHHPAREQLCQWFREAAAQEAEPHVRKVLIRSLCRLAPVEPAGYGYLQPSGEVTASEVAQAWLEVRCDDDTEWEFPLRPDPLAPALEELALGAGEPIDEYRAGAVFGNSLMALSELSPSARLGIQYRDWTFHVGRVLDDHSIEDYSSLADRVQDRHSTLRRLNRVTSQLIENRAPVAPGEIHALVAACSNAGSLSPEILIEAISLAYRALMCSADKDFLLLGVHRALLFAQVASRDPVMDEALERILRDFGRLCHKVVDPGALLRTHIDDWSINGVEVHSWALASLAHSPRLDADVIHRVADWARSSGGRAILNLPVGDEDAADQDRKLLRLLRSMDTKTLGRHENSDFIAMMLASRGWLPQHRTALLQARRVSRASTD